jgi:VanZ family protein
MMALIFWLSDQPRLDSGLGVVDLILRKAIHLTEYGALCYLWWRALRDVMTANWAAGLAFTIAVLYAMTDEYHQTFIDGRQGVWSDVLIDAIGAGVVATVVLLRSRGSGKPA